MPALSGQVVMTLRDGSGNVVIQATVSYVDGTGALRDALVHTSAGDKTGAFVVDNLTARPVHVVVTDGSGNPVRSFAIPPNGLTRTVVQMDALTVTNLSQLNGLTFDLA